MGILSKVIFCIAGASAIMVYILRLPISKKYFIHFDPESISLKFKFLCCLCLIFAFINIVLRPTIGQAININREQSESLRRYLAKEEVSYYDIAWIARSSLNQRELIRREAINLGVSEDKLRQALTEELRCFWIPKQKPEKSP